METFDFILTFFLGLIIVLLSSMFFNAYFFDYKKKKNKEDILILEKSILTLICYIFYMIICFYCAFDDDDSTNLRFYLYKYQLNLFNLFITIFFIIRLFMSLEFYYYFKNPNYIFNSIIYNYKKHFWYEIILIIIPFLLNYPIIKTYKFFDKDNKLIPFYLFDEFKWFILIIISFSALTIYLKSYNIVRLFSFKSKQKFKKVCKKNILLSILYLSFSLFHGFKILYIKIKGKPIDEIYYSSSYSSLILILLDYLIELYFLVISKFCQYKLRQTLIGSIRKTFIKSENSTKIENINTLLNSVSDFSEDSSSSTFTSNISTGDEELVECYRNGYIFEDYIYDYYDEILNISLLSIFNVYQVKTFSERSQTRSLRKAFNVSNTLSMSKSKSNSNFSVNQIPHNQYNFIRSEKKNDFNRFENILFGKELENLILDKDLYLNVKISSFYNHNILEVLNAHNSKVVNITNSLLKHMNVNNKLIDNSSSFESLIFFNVKSEYFNSLKNLSLKTKDKEYQIDIFEGKTISNELDSILEKYFVHISNTTNTFLPLLLGVFIIEINDIQPILLFISRNSIVENIQKDTYSFWQLVRFSNNNVLSLSSSQSINNSYIVKNDPIFERNYEIETKEDDINHNKIILKNYNEFMDILNKDISILKSLNLTRYNLLMMYYEYENEQKHEKKGKITIKKKGSKAEIVNIGSINNSEKSTFSIPNEDDNLFDDDFDLNNNNNEIIDLNNNINVCSYDGTFHHFNCLCYFMFENIFDLKKSFFQKENYSNNFLNNMNKYFAEFK